MRRTSLLSIVAAAIAVGTAACVPPGGPGPAPGGGNSKTDCATRSTNGRGLAVVGLVADGSLVCFRDNNTNRLATIGTLTGLDQDTSLIGIDYRPANDTLYGVGNAGGVYTVDASTAAVDARQPAQPAAAGHVVRRRLQPDRRPPAHRVRHRPEPARQRRRRHGDRRTAR